MTWIDVKNGEVRVGQIRYNTDTSKDEAHQSTDRNAACTVGGKPHSNSRREFPRISRELRQIAANSKSPRIAANCAAKNTQIRIAIHAQL